MVLVAVHIAVRARREDHNPIFIGEQNACEVLETTSHPRDTRAVLPEWRGPRHCKLSVIDGIIRADVLIVQTTIWWVGSAWRFK
jgi:hypothetical protein